jgi:hypothetical protein
LSKAGTSGASAAALVVASFAALFRHESRGRCLLTIPAGTARRGNQPPETTRITPLVPAYIYIFFKEPLATAE